MNGGGLLVEDEGRELAGFLDGVAECGIHLVAHGGRENFRHALAHHDAHSVLVEDLVVGVQVSECVLAGGEYAVAVENGAYGGKTASTGLE